MSSTSIIEINLAAIDHNFGLLRRLVGPECGICPIIKADAYGLGAARVGRRLEAAGARMLAVYTPEQAGELFAAALGLPVLVLMPVRQIDRVGELYRGLVCGRLHLSIHDGEHLDEVIALAERFGVRVPVHLAVDTGMARGGCDLAEAGPLIERLARAPRIELAGIYTHFASADADPAWTAEQMKRFDDLLAQHRGAIPTGCLVHAANTFAAFRHQRYHRSMVRVGLAWSGYGTELMRGKPVSPLIRRLRPTVTWTSRIVQVRSVPSGTAVGYGRTWTAPRDSRIGLIPVGYADGYPQRLGASDADHEHAGQVAVITDGPHGEQRAYVPVVGAVNMDQITVDLTGLADGVRVGTPVELVTPDVDAPNHLTRLAASAGTLPHVILSSLNPRLKRVYVDDAAFVHTLPPAAAVAG